MSKAKKVPKVEENVKKDDFDESWLKYLISSQIVTEEWKCIIALFVESDPRDSLYLDKFNETAKNESRMVIKVITYEETLIMVKQIGSSKSPAPEEKIFDIANNFIKNGNPIPEDMLALLIKKQILQLKTNDCNIEISKNEEKSGLQKESLLMISAGTEGPKTASKKVAASIKESKKEDIISDKKFHTDLRMIGEEWKDKTYIEDYPKDGPNLYIALIGFRKSKLIQELINIHVPLVAVVKLGAETEAPQNESINTESETSTKLSSSSNKLTKLSPEIEIFWEDIDLAKYTPEISILYKNIAFISFIPPYKDILPEGKTANDIIYDEVSFLMYDIQDLTRQHKHYLDNMKILDVDEVLPKLEIENLKVYKQIVGNIPSECTDISHALFGILKQVEYLIDPNKTLQDDSLMDLLNTSNTYDEHLFLSRVKETATQKTRNIIHKLFQDKNMTDKICESHSQQVKDVESQVTLIPWGDSVKRKILNLDILLDLHKITIDTMSCLPIPKIWNQHSMEFQGTKIKDKTDIFYECIKRQNFSLNNAGRVLNLMCCKKLCDERFFYDFQLYYRNLHKKKKVSRRTSISPIPSNLFLKSDSFTYGESPNINYIEFPIQSIHRFSLNLESLDSQTDDIIDILESEKIFLEAEPKEQFYDINDYHYFEELTASSMLQSLNSAYFKFNTGHIKYCPVNDRIIIVFFNKIINSVNEYHWEQYIPSRVCLSDFFDYVLEKEYDWIVKKEKFLDEQVHKQFVKLQKENTSESTQLSQEPVVINFESEMILKDSLKYIDSLENPIDVDAQGKRSSHNINNLETGVSKESSLTDIQENTHQFIGYNLGDICVKTAGKSNSFYSKDGTVIIVDIYNNFDDTYNVSVQMITSNYDLFVHSQYNQVTHLISNINKLRFLLNNGINLVFFQTEKTIKVNSSHTFVESVKKDKKFIQTLQLSIPNGLFIEPVYTHYDDLPSYIRQKYLTKGPECKKILNELYRCYSLKGEIIIYKSNGDIEVLCPDSTIYVYKKSTDDSSINPRDAFKSQLDDISDSQNEPKGSATHGETLKFDETKDDISSNYDVIFADGKYQQIRNGKIIQEDKLLMRTATDYVIGEVYTRRLDGTNVLLNKNGLQVVTFPDGSKISTYYIESGELDKETGTVFDISKDKKSYMSTCHLSTIIEENSCRESSYSLEMENFYIIDFVYVMEHPNYASIKVDTSNQTIILNLPQKISINIDQHGVYQTTFPDLSVITLNIDNLKILDTKCIGCVSQSLSKLNLSYEYNQEGDDTLLMNYDCFDKVFSLNYKGVCSLRNKTDIEDSLSCGSKCERNVCCRAPPEEERRFFVMKRDLSGEEFLHKRTAENFKYDFGSFKWSCIKTDKDPFNDDFSYETILFPINKTESQSWLVEPLVIEINPTRIVNADLKDHNTKGIYTWMRPYPREKVITTQEKNNKGEDTPSGTPSVMGIRIFRRLMPSDWDVVKNMEMILEKYISFLKNEKRLANPTETISKQNISEDEISSLGREIYSELLKSFDTQLVLVSTRRTLELTIQENIRKILEQHEKDRIKEEFYREALRTKKIPKYEYPPNMGES